MRSNFTILLPTRHIANLAFVVFANENWCRNVVRLNFSARNRRIQFSRQLSVYSICYSYSIILLLLLLLLCSSLALVHIHIGFVVFHCIHVNTSAGVHRQCRLAQSIFIFIRSFAFFYFSIFVICVSAHISSVGSQQKRIFTKTKTTKSIKGQHRPKIRSVSLPVDKRMEMKLTKKEEERREQKDLHLSDVI